MYHYLIEPKAQKEFELSIEWYSERSEQTAIEFIESIESTIHLVCQRPQQFKIVYKNFHEAITEIFPFSIIYSIEEKIKTVVIISIYHNKRNPKKKYK